MIRVGPQPRETARTCVRRRARVIAAAAMSVGGTCTLGVNTTAHAEDLSSAPILQWFDGSWKTMERRTSDVFEAGYGSIWGPPPGRADSGNTSVGYDVYDRFDLGSAGNATLYGTEAGIRSTIQ